MSYQNLEHPAIARCLETGYPYPIREDPDDEEETGSYDEDWGDFPDEDAAFEETRERRAGW